MSEPNKFQQERAMSDEADLTVRPAGETFVLCSGAAELARGTSDELWARVLARLRATGGRARRYEIIAGREVLTEQVYEVPNGAP